MTVIERAANRANGDVMWLCRCACGQDKVVRAAKLKGVGTKSCGCLRKQAGAARRDDLAGRKFGRLTVLEPRASRGDKTAWLCRCECGQQKEITSSNLTTGRSLSCGCLQRERVAESLVHDLTGQQFGRWTVIARAERPSSRPTTWLCRCSCGQEKPVAAGSLMSGDSLSCGCLKRERTSERLLHDLTGQRFGRLSVIERVEDRGRAVTWLCRCECGNESRVGAAALKNGNTQSCGCLRTTRGIDKLHDLTGQTFGTWLVKRRAPSGANYTTRWICHCIDCDGEKTFAAAVLVDNRAGACACQRTRRKFDRTAAAHLRSLGFEPGQGVC